MATMQTGSRSVRQSHDHISRGPPDLVVVQNGGNRISGAIGVFDSMRSVATTFPRYALRWSRERWRCQHLPTESLAPFRITIVGRQPWRSWVVLTDSLTSPCSPDETPWMVNVDGLFLSPIENLIKICQFNYLFFLFFC